MDKVSRLKTKASKRFSMYDLMTIPKELETRFTAVQIKEYKDAFRLFDKDGNGVISTKEVITVLKSLGKDPSEEETIDMMSEYDKNGNGTIEFVEFLFLIGKIMEDSYSTTDLVDVFRVIDQDGDGIISKADLREIIIRLGTDISSTEIDDMIDVADKDGDGHIGFEEFRETVMMR